MHLNRTLQLKLPRGQSAFLWGARKTGKTTFLQQRFPHSIVYDLLKSDLFIEFSKQPSLLREELLATPAARLKTPIIIDEVQKIPALLDEIHWLIENRRLSFILCGSSARKLKRGHGNLLGGRAWRFEMLPLTTREIPNFDLLRALNHGLVPSHYLQSNAACRRSLKAYVVDYLKEEILAEGLTRNISAFARFLDAAGYSHGELINYSNIAADCGVDAKSVKEYFQILQDTLLGVLVEPFKQRQNRQVISRAPKFYLFDVGVAGYLSGRNLIATRGKLFGKAFEHFILMEILAYRAYQDLDFPINFWRTKSGMEVDFVLGRGKVAIEVKGQNRIRSVDLRGVSAFRESHASAAAYVVCQIPRQRCQDNITVMPWSQFLDRLWAGKII